MKYAASCITASTRFILNMFWLVALGCVAKLAYAFDDRLFVPPASSPEAKVLAHYRESGVVPEIKLFLVPRHVQREALMILNAAHHNSHPFSGKYQLGGKVLTSRECEHLRSAQLGEIPTPLAAVGVVSRIGGLNDRNLGSWVVEEPTRLANTEVAAANREGVRIFGAVGYRTFVAAHELGHAALRAIVDSGRLQRELPESFPALAADEVFQEAFCDLLALETMVALRYPGTASKIAGLISQFRRRSGQELPEYANQIFEISDLLDGYSKTLSSGSFLGRTIDVQITRALRFLAQSGVFESMLAGPEIWQRIRDEGCMDCFQRRPYYVRKAWIQQ